ncbi:RagB/SusD family nutrient uptake outer membrane protein [Flavobacterium agricola]|uniref:RagB/SusD family nutrient uptake outer membrane protein n=1 Tax=Flavobacterium agricola TaxID=2870839 RepID=A0ABY6LW55_9FLAO|nr:RagB/SusD family nutrient uptake outer membrane protein [Flavobacterium agricola]UYW00558.1 RagB/SusD family nutrient uptake outer membrane protein [Flavobacterium agricola]
MKKIIYSIASIVALSAATVSCSNDSLEPNVVDQENISVNPVSSETQLRMTVNGAYKYMSAAAYYGRDYVIFNEVHSDNSLSNGASGRFVSEGEFTTTITSSYPADTWAAIYQVIAMSNIAINADVTDGDPDAINAIKAEAYAIRALAHFDLMKLFGQQNVTLTKESLTIPYISLYGVVTDANYTRITLTELDAKLNEDIDQAIALAGNDITTKTAFNKQAILALKARVNLYLAPFFGDQKYVVANQAATEALALGGQVATATELAANFKLGEVGINSVFELQFLANDNLGTNSLYQIYNNTPYGDVYVVKEVKDVLFADENDIRGTFVTVDAKGVLRNTGKYGDRADNVKIIRFEEIVLTAAETAFRMGDTAKALELVNKIAENRGIEAYTAVTLDIIINERHKEFVSEGFRFDDLMRLQMNVPQVTGRSVANTPAYGDYRLAFPIPQRETNVSPIQQNQGY